VPVETEIVGHMCKSKRVEESIAKKEFIAFWKCKYSGCSYIYAQKSGDSESKDVRNKIVQHLNEGNGHFSEFAKKAKRSEEASDRLTS